MRNKFLIIVLLGLQLSCAPNFDFSKIVPNHVDEFANEFIAVLKQGDIDKCLSLVIPEMNTLEGREYLTGASRNIQTFQLDSFRIINARRQIKVGDNGYSNYSIDYEYFIPGKYLYFTFGIQERDNKLAVSGFSGSFYENSLTRVHEFNFVNKSFSHYLFFVFSILTPLFILATIAASIKTTLRKKWLWIIGMLFGISKTTINWTTGKIFFSLINVQLLGVGFSKQGLVAPWTLSFSIPIVALTFWFKRYKDLSDRKNAEISKGTQLE